MKQVIQRDWLSGSYYKGYQASHRHIVVDSNPRNIFFNTFFHQCTSSISRKIHLILRHYYYRDFTSPAKKAIEWREHALKRKEGMYRPRHLSNSGAPLNRLFLSRDDDDDAYLVRNKRFLLIIQTIRLTNLKIL